MRIALLSPASNIHTRRWANGLAERGLDVHLISIHDAMEGYRPEVTIHRLPGTGCLGYFIAAPALQRLISNLHPDLVNAHYASGYGTLARLAGCHPLLLSVWGSDVYDFPAASRIHRWWLKSNIAAADALASTSHSMALHTKRFTKPEQPIAITPFGIDVERFSSSQRNQDDKIRIGTIKTLLPKYGIDVLLQAFAHLKKILPDEPSKRLILDIVGEGKQHSQLESLSEELGIAADTSFSGRIPHEAVPARLSCFDVYVALSRLDSESFGVAILEAGACGVPVVVSDVSGLSEVVVNNETGFVVPRENPRAAAEAIAKLITDPSLRARMGQAARKHVIAKYTWEHSLDLMIEAYAKLTNQNR